MIYQQQIPLKQLYEENQPRYKVPLVPFDYHARASMNIIADLELSAPICTLVIFGGLICLVLILGRKFPTFHKAFVSKSFHIVEQSKEREAESAQSARDVVSDKDKKEQMRIERLLKSSSSQSVPSTLSAEPYQTSTHAYSMDNSEIILSRIHEDMRALVQLNRKQHFWIRAFGIVYLVIPVVYGAIYLLARGK